MNSEKKDNNPRRKPGRAPDAALAQTAPAARGSGMTVRRLLRSLCLIGDPKFRAWLAWLALLPQLAWCFYYLMPVFMYYAVGVPPKEALEEITGVWREEGKLTSTHSQLIAPKYFLDTETGSRQVHCGFPTQHRLCHPPWCDIGARCTVLYDSYFGILAYEQIDPPRLSENIQRMLASGRLKELRPLRMSYEEGVFFYAQPSHLLRLNNNAHRMLALYLAVYAYLVFRCWQATSPSGRKS